MITRRSILGSIVGLFASIPFIKCVASEKEESKDGIMAIVVCETPEKIQSKLCKAQTMNDFKQIGFKMMPDATRISVCFDNRAKSKYTIFEGQGFRWNLG